MGPAAPMSTSALRVRGRLRRRITAPSVPISESRGAGMKKGQVASTPCRRASTKWPISCASRMASRVPERAIPCRTASACVGGGSCVSVSSAPATNADAAVIRKRNRFRSGGRRLPSVPGAGRSTVKGASLTRSSGQPLPCFLKVTEQAAAAQQSSRHRRVRAGLRLATELVQRARDVLVQVRATLARLEGAGPGLDRLLQAAGFGERDPQAGERVGVLWLLQQRLLEPRDRILVPLQAD